VDIELEVAVGEVHGLLGPNGAGKSTTLAILAGLIEPDDGTIAINGSSNNVSASVRACIGFAPQALAIYPELTAQENIEFFAGLYGMRGKRLKERVAWALDFVALSSQRERRARTFSGGMLRRLNLACAIVHDPALLLLDEPTAGVDPQSRQHLLSNIRELAKAGVGVVYSTHQMYEAEELCDRVTIVDQGRVLACGTVAELTAGEAATHAGPRSSAQHRTELVASAETALEAVFLRLTHRRLRDC
jgi:ABC-2 type transport system ATP-binding protein